MLGGKVPNDFFRRVSLFDLLVSGQSVEMAAEPLVVVPISQHLTQRATEPARVDQI